MSPRPLRESVEQLREYIYGGASSFAGPEPGKGWTLNVTGAGTPQARLFRDRQKAKDTEKERAQKRKKTDFRPDLRKLSLWLQQKHGQ